MKDVNTGRIGRFFEAIPGLKIQAPRSNIQRRSKHPRSKLITEQTLALGSWKFLDLGSWILDLPQAIIAPMNTRLRTALLLILAGLPAFSQPNTNQSQARPSLPPGVKVMRDLEYGQASGRAMLLDLYLPEKVEKMLPLIIWVHGGAWMGGSKDGRSPALQFTTEGYAVAHIGYRLSGEAKFPAQINDCKAAVRWLRANAEKYQLDP